MYTAIMLMTIGYTDYTSPVAVQQVRQVVSKPVLVHQVKQVVSRPVVVQQVKQVVSRPVVVQQVEQVEQVEQVVVQQIEDACTHEVRAVRNRHPLLRTLAFIGAAPARLVVPRIRR